MSMTGRIIEVGSGEYWSVKSLEDYKAHGTTHDRCDVYYDRGITIPAYAVIGAKMNAVYCQPCLDRLSIIAKTYS